MLVLCGLIPVALQAAWFALGIDRSRKKLIPEHRRTAMIVLFAGFAVVLAMAGPPLAFVLQARTGFGLPVSDVWFGSVRGRGIMETYLYLALATLAVGSPLFIWKFAVGQRRFTRALEAEDPYQVPVEVRRADARERYLRLGVLLVGFVVLLVVSILVPTESPLHRYAQMAIAAMTGMGAHLLSAALSYKKRRPVKVSDMDELYRRISGVVGTFGIRLRDLQIEEGIDGHRYVELKATRDGRVLISRKAIEIMTPEELDYLIGMEFVGSQIKLAYPSYLLLAFLPVIFLVLLTVWMITTQQFKYVWIVILANVAVMFGAMALWKWSMLRARPTGAPLPAQMASNPDAARSAIAKKLKYGPLGSRMATDSRMAAIMRQFDTSPEGSPKDDGIR